MINTQIYWFLYLYLVHSKVINRYWSWPNRNSLSKLWSKIFTHSTTGAHRPTPTTRSLTWICPRWVASRGKGSGPFWVPRSHRAKCAKCFQWYASRWPSSSRHLTGALKITKRSTLRYVCVWECDQMSSIFAIFIKNNTMKYLCFKIFGTFYCFIKFIQIIYQGYYPTGHVRVLRNGCDSEVRFCHQNQRSSRP